MKAKQLTMAVLAVLAMTMLNACSPKDAIIKSSVAATNLLCPHEIREGISLVKAEYTDGYVIYSVQCDEGFSEFSGISGEDIKREVVEAMKKSTAEEQSEDAANIFDVILKFDVGFIVRFFNDDTSMDIVFEPEDLRYMFE